MPETQNLWETSLKNKDNRTFAYKTQQRIFETIRRGVEEKTSSVENAAMDGIHFAPLSPTIGAEVSGIHLSEPLDQARKKTLYDGLLKYKVIFFRDQDITTEEHIAFAKNFGSLEVHPFAPVKEGFPEVLPITHNEDNPGQENVWHSDVTWRKKPSLGSILRLLEVPETGGDTLFADMYSAYDGLSDEVKEKIDGLVAIHDFAPFRARLKQRGATEEEIEEFNKKYPKVEHPVVRTHPDTGRKGIYVNVPFTETIKDMEHEEAQHLLEYLCAQAAIPEYQCRFRWKKNSIAFWDNRCAQHYASADYWPQRRTAERVTVEGDKPF